MARRTGSLGSVTIDFKSTSSVTTFDRFRCTPGLMSVSAAEDRSRLEATASAAEIPVSESISNKSEKVKRPRTQKQEETFKRCQQRKKELLLEAKRAKEGPGFDETKFKTYFESATAEWKQNDLQTMLSTAVEEALEKRLKEAAKEKKKAEPVVHEDYSEEEEVVYPPPTKRVKPQTSQPVRAPEQIIKRPLNTIPLMRYSYGNNRNIIY